MNISQKEINEIAEIFGNHQNDDDGFKYEVAHELLEYFETKNIKFDSKKFLDICFEEN